MAVLLCLRGTIFLYQGEELGLPQANVPFEKLRDPFDIAAYGGEVGRDGARTPMPWTSEAPSAGFSSAADTWLPVDEAHLTLAAALQENDADSFLRFTRRLIAIRQGSTALRIGAATVLPAPESVLAFDRNCRDERLTCVFNLSAGEVTYPVGVSANLVAAFNGAVSAEGGSLILPPYAAIIVRTAEVS